MQQDLESFIHRRMRAIGLSMGELADSAQITRAHLRRVITGQTSNPGILTLHKLAIALKVQEMGLLRYFLGHDIHCDIPDVGVRHINPQNNIDVLAFVDDVTVPDHSVMMAGEKFVKTWAVQNAGQVNWVGRRLVRVDQNMVVAERAANGNLTPLLDAYLDSLGREVEVPNTPPGHIAELSVSFMAPRENCSVASIWQFVDNDNQLIYRNNCFLQCIVTVLG
jgi:hypothetical protein